MIYPNGPGKEPTYLTGEWKNDRLTNKGTLVRLFNTCVSVDLSGCCVFSFLDLHATVQHTFHMMLYMLRYVRLHTYYGQVYPDGERYEGGLQDGKMHGKGVYKYANGDQHVGEWRNGLRHGPGVMVFAATSVSARTPSAVVC